MSLLTLPADIHDTIIDQLLSGVPDPIFIPVCKKCDYDYGDSGDLMEKFAENYGGERSHDQLESAQTLMDLSSSCRYFRSFLSPRLFRCVILRSRPKSFASVKTLMQTKIWNYIEHFVFVGTEYEFNQDGELVRGRSGTEGSEEKCYTPARVQNRYGSVEPGKVEEDTEECRDEYQPIANSDAENESGRSKYDLNAEMTDIHSVMSNLPPTLKSITLDFPNGWTFPWTMDMIEGGVWNTGGPEGGRRYRAQLETVVSATSLNDISSKTEFELRLLSIPFVECPAFESERFHQFLMHVTSFTLGLCHHDNGDGCQVNAYNSNQPNGSDTVQLASSFPRYFFNHLRRVNTLHLLADSSWPLGDTADGIGQIDLKFPRTADHMPMLEHVFLRYLRIGSQLTDFLRIHMASIRTVTLSNCVAVAFSEEEMLPGEIPTTWQSFFANIANAQPKNLTQFTLGDYEESLEELLGNADEEIKEDYNEIGCIVIKDRRKAYEVLKEQDGELEVQTDPSDRAKILRRQRQVFQHVEQWEDYGMTVPLQWTNAQVFLQGDTHEQWLRVLDIMEENQKTSRSPPLI